MKNVAIIAILALIFIFSQNPVQAASELETWCLSVGETWDSAYSKCTVNGIVSSTEPLNILPDESLYIHGTLSVEGNIYNAGEIWTVFGNLYNYAIIENNNTLAISDFSEFINYGSLINNGMFGTVDFSQSTNNGVVTNIGRFDVALSYFTNNNLINNYCPGTFYFYGETFSGNPIVYFENCVHLPAILK